MAAGGIGANTSPGALIALFIFCALAAFEALAPVIGAFQHLGQVIASANRITQITSQHPDVTFPLTQQPVPRQVSLKFSDVSFTYPGQPNPALHHINLTIKAGGRIAIIGCTGCGKSTLLQLITRA